MLGTDLARPRLAAITAAPLDHLARRLVNRSSTWTELPSVLAVLLVHGLPADLERVPDLGPRPALRPARRTCVRSSSSSSRRSARTARSPTRGSSAWQPWRDPTRWSWCQCRLTARCPRAVARRSCSWGSCSRRANPTPRDFSPAADRGHRVRQQPATPGQHHPARLGGVEHEAVPRRRRAVVHDAAPAGSTRSSGQAVAQPDLEQHPLHRAGSRSSSTSPSVRRARRRRCRAAYALGCLTFHQRTPPTWECAPGPTPHQSRWSSRARCAGSGCLVARPVRDLVPPQPGRGEARSSASDVLVGEVVVVRHRELAACAPGGRGGCRPPRSGSTPRRGRAAQASAASTEACPVGERLPRRAVDQVEADLLEAGLPRPRDGRGHPRRVVGAVQRRAARAARPTASRRRSG